MTDLRWASRIAVVLGVVVAVFLLAPLLVILPVAFSADSFLVFPPQQWSARWFGEVLGDPAWRDALGLSARIALGAAALATVAGTCAAFALRRLRRGGRALRTVLVAPLVVPQLVLALGLYLAVDDLGGRAGLGTLLVGQAVLATPIVYLSVAAGLSGVDPALARAGLSLGHSWPSVLLRIELPLVARSVVGAAVLAFGLCFDESVLAYYLSPPGQETLPTRIWLDAGQSASPAIAAVSALIIGFAVVLLGLSVVVRRRR
ncbi:ABC transporter permease [Cryptosporangium phraense]|uniref:ABC transporter permease n=1 Tax=Cryptosporangium phraense TaxID=2593070 RepID=A0A545AVR1_9ACTN|nr:ABC transporter permease [Cryptosporangium phraense]TQS45428.1 ABC transporter permease [Cryptosporangium phraense]